MLKCGSGRIRNAADPRPDSFGTLACLLRRGGQNDTGERWGLTCGHVVAPPGFGNLDRFIVEALGNAVGEVRAGTLPNFDRIDAAAVLLSVACEPIIDGIGVPTGWRFIVTEGLAVHAVGARTGWMSGRIVSVDKVDEVIVFHRDGGGQSIGWTLRRPILCNRLEGSGGKHDGGDSGAIVIDGFGLIVGLLVGLWPDQSGQELSVVVPIKPILETLGLRLGLTADTPLEPVVSRVPFEPLVPLPTPPIPPPPPELDLPWEGAIRQNPPQIQNGRAAAIDVLARTLWGEAQIEFLKARGLDGRLLRDVAYRAVAEVIVNRAVNGHRGQTTVEGVCLDPKQFSCWNPGARGRDKITAPGVRLEKGFREAEQTASLIVDGWTSNLTKGSRHYYAKFLDAEGKTPDWGFSAPGKLRLPVAEIGNHKFFNDVV